MVLVKRITDVKNLQMKLHATVLGGWGGGGGGGGVGGEGAGGGTRSNYPLKQQVLTPPVTNKERVILGKSRGNFISINLKYLWD